MKSRPINIPAVGDEDVCASSFGIVHYVRSDSWFVRFFFPPLLVSNDENRKIYGYGLSTFAYKIKNPKSWFRWVSKFYEDWYDGPLAGSEHLSYLNRMRRLIGLGTVSNEDREKIMIERATKAKPLNYKQILAVSIGAMVGSGVAIFISTLI